MSPDSQYINAKKNINDIFRNYARKSGKIARNIDHFRAEKLCLSAILTFSNFQKVRYRFQITTYQNGFPSVVRYLGLCPLLCFFALILKPLT